MKTMLTMFTVSHWRTRLQLALLFTLAMMLSQGVSLWIIKNQNANLQEAINRFHLLENTSSDITLLNVLNNEQRTIGIMSLSDHRKNLFMAQQAWPMDEQRSLDDLALRLSQMLDFPISRIRITNKITNEQFCIDGQNSLNQEKTKVENNCNGNFFISAQLDDGTWLNFSFRLGPPSKLLIEKVLPSVLISLLLIIIITNLTLNRIVSPLQQLCRAAEKVGRGETYLIPASGPQDVKQTIIAFNDMQNKLSRYIKDRTQLMAAISHDLRTPITVMRLRLELFEDNEDKLKLLETLEEMENITTASLDFVRESNVDESTKDIDMNALLASICDDLQDTGLKINYHECGRSIYSCRSNSLKRALTNLIHNGAIYGERVDVTLLTSKNKQAIEIHIDDHGPGIPSDMHEQIFEPFVRLENSRNRKTGGTGLGLSIARTIIRHHGGDIQLQNKTDGFRVVVQLP